VNPFAAPPGPVNPFAAPPVNPFASPNVPPTLPLAHPAPVNPFAHLPEPAPPFAPPPSYPPPPQPYPAQPHLAPGTRPLIGLRPLSIFVAVAAGFHAIALLYGLWGVAVLTPATTRYGADRVLDVMKTGENLYNLSLLLLLGAVIPWLCCAGANVRRVCADKSKFGPAAAGVGFAIPLLNVVVIGRILQDLWRHSSERARGPSALIRTFYILVLSTLAVRVLLAGVAASQIKRAGLALFDGAFYVFGIGDPIRFFAMFGGESQRGFIILVSLASVAVPVLAAIACFKIEIAQKQAHRRLRSAAL
jgi:hypothetical protein